MRVTSFAQETQHKVPNQCTNPDRTIPQSLFVFTFMLLQYISVFVTFNPILLHNYYDDEVLPISTKYSWFVEKILNICKISLPVISAMKMH